MLLSACIWGKMWEDIQYVTLMLRSSGFLQFLWIHESWIGW